jgi:membrane protease YdiL (CAAX protease family)
MKESLSFALEILVLLLFFGSCLSWVGIIRRLLRRQTLIPYEPRSPVPWNGWDVLLLVFIVMMLDVVALRGTSQGQDLEVAQISPRAVAMASLAHGIALFFAIAFLSAKAQANIDDLGFDLRKLRSDIVLGLKTFVAVIAPVNGLQLLLVQLIPSEHPLQKLTQDHPVFELVALAAVAAVIVAPLFEEFVFRVLLQGWLEKSVAGLQPSDETGTSATPAPAGYLAIVAVSLIFGMLHWGHGPDPIPLFVFSLIVGYVYHQTHRIIAPLVVHVCFNSLAVLDLASSIGS